MTCIHVIIEIAIGIKGRARGQLFWYVREKISCKVIEIGTERWEGVPIIHTTIK